MPTIGAGKHGYPEDLVLKIIREEFEITCSQNVGKTSLKNVSVIIFAENQSLGSSGQSTNLSDAHPHSLQPLPIQTIGPTPNSQANPLPTIGNTDHSMRIGKTDEIEVRFIGIKQNIESAISDVKTFVDGNSDKKSIENIGHILRECKSDIERLSKDNEVLIEWSLTGCMTVQGLKSDVADFLVEFAELRGKHELDQQKKKWLSEMSQYVQWWYFSAGRWVSYDQITNKEIETAYREDTTKKFDICINGEDYHVDLGNKEKKGYTSGQLVKIERTLQSDQDDSSGMYFRLETYCI